MTKMEAIDKAWTLLGLLEAMPDGVDIMQESVGECTGFQINLNSGIETVAESFDLTIIDKTPKRSEYIHRYAKSKICRYVQLEMAKRKEAAPGVDSTRDGEAAQSATKDTSIINVDRKECQYEYPQRK